jgi:hypothetical protein
MSKATLSEDTILTIGKGISLGKFAIYLAETTGVEMPGVEFQQWFITQVGITLKEATVAYIKAAERKSITELMSEKRFDIISDDDKTFIIAFSDKIEQLGYHFGGGIGEGYGWGKFMIIYPKAGVKGKKVAARIFIGDTGVIVLRLYFNNVDKHRNYIERSNEHIKAVFIGEHGNCNCNPKKVGCRARKTYTIDGKLIEKCGGVVFEFLHPTMENLADYIDLLNEFYPIKAKK